jgi:hypothetical protein
VVDVGGEEGEDWRDEMKRVGKWNKWGKWPHQRKWESFVSKLKVQIVVVLPLPVVSLQNYL